MDPTTSSTPPPVDGASSAADKDTTGNSSSWVSPSMFSASSLVMVNDLSKSCSAVTSWIHPGHFFLTTSLPFCWIAYRGFRAPLDRVVETVLAKHNVAPTTMTDLTQTELVVRRTVGSVLAGRALRVATCASIGGFGLLTAGLFYLSNCQTLEEAVTSTREWAQRSRQQMDAALGIENRIDQDHPEYLLTQSMSEDEELEYVAKTYLPDEQWVDPDENDSKSDKDKSKQ